MSRFQNRFKAEQGFTLIELLVVMIIIGLLAALVGPKLFGKVTGARQQAAKAQIELFNTSLDAFRLDTGRYPSTSEGLESLRNNPGSASNWDGPYISKPIPKDPWGKDYLYTCPGSNGEFDLVSYGLDGSPGGEGENQDIVSWENLK